MTVRQLVEILQTCDQDALVITNGFGSGRTEVTAVERLDVGGLEHRYSFEYVHVVEISDGNVPHMLKQGMDVVGHWPASPTGHGVVHFEKRFGDE